jgi:polyphosphate glucokinase
MISSNPSSDAPVPPASDDKPVSSAVITVAGPVIPLPENEPVQEPAGPAPAAGVPPVSFAVPPAPAPAAMPPAPAPAPGKPGEVVVPVTAAPDESGGKEAAPASILVVDIGGTKVKMLVKGQTEPRKAASGKEFTPARLIELIGELTADWEYQAISIGYPGLVGTHGPQSEPGNLGPGWVGFDFTAALGKPVKIMNDAVMQALGSYDGGRMLFLGLGTGLGSALIAGQVIVPLELGRLRYDDEHSIGEMLGRAGVERIGKAEWRRLVNVTVTAFMHAFLADYVVIGGGNAKTVKDLPPGARRGNNLTAFRGGYRLWGAEDVWVMATPGGQSPESATPQPLRVV